MIQKEDDGFDYRSPVNVGPAKMNTPQDEQDYSTLSVLSAELNKAITDLYKDFNAFDATDPKVLQAQVAGRQVAYDILTPIQTRINSIVDGIKNNEGDA